MSRYTVGTAALGALTSRYTIGAAEQKVPAKMWAPVAIAIVGLLAAAGYVSAKN